MLNNFRTNKCQINKEFIFSLFPSGKIYTTFLPAEARNSIGKVGKETEPVLHMLKKIGFQYKDQVDPFDGGPHLWAHVDEVLPIKKIKSLLLNSSSVSTDSPMREVGLLCKSRQSSGEFRAVAVTAVIHEGKLHLLESAAKSLQSALDLNLNDAVTFMPYY